MKGESLKKNILYLRTDITYKELIAGGAVSHTVGVIDGFTALGFTVVCAAASMVAVLQKTEVTELKILQNPGFFKCLKWRINCLLSNLFFTQQARRLFARYSFAYIYQRYSPLNCTGIILSKLKKIPLILEYNGSEVWMDNNWAKKRVLQFTAITTWFELFNLRNAHTVVVVSQVLKDELISRGIAANTIVVNPNGVNAQDFDAAKLINDRQAIREQLTITDKHVIGFVGTFAAWHGIDIIAALIDAMKEQHNVHFLLIGDGPLLPELRASIAYQQNNNVTCTGLLPAAIAKKYMSACDLFFVTN